MAVRRWWLIFRKDRINWSKPIRPLPTENFSNLTRHLHPSCIMNPTFEFGGEEKGENTKGTWPPIFIHPFPAQRVKSIKEGRKSPAWVQLLPTASAHCSDNTTQQGQATPTSLLYSLNASQTDPLASSPSASSLPPFLCCTYWLVYLCFKNSHPVLF